MKHSTRLLPLFLTVLLAASPAALICQSTFATIRGAATDPDGAAIPGADATLRSLDQGATRTATSDTSGSFVFANVNPGRYTLTVSHEGFATLRLENVTVDSRQDLRLPARLLISTSSETINVISGPDQINTEDAVIADSKNNQMITQLPLNDRAGTTSPLGALALSANVQQDSNGYIALGGASSSMVNFSVDGISTVNVRQNGALQDAYPSQEGIAAVKVTASNNSAEFSQVGDVTFTTKSGTGQFHGGVFEYMQNDALDAAPYGFSSKAPKHFNTFGAALGGPVRIPHLLNGKNTFFFVDYEGNRRRTATLQQFLVPSAQDRSGNLSDICGPMITNIGATAKALLNYLPLPNVADGFSCSNGTFTPAQSYNYTNFQRTPSATDGVR